MRVGTSPVASLLLVLSFLQSIPLLAAKSTTTSFCKCICFNNSTIIALNPPSSSTQPSSLHNLDIRSPIAHADSPEPIAEPVVKRDAADSDGSSSSPSRPHHKLSCADCTRAFCLDYNLPICKDAREEDVFTTCFQRDSLKDETVVVVFIFATAGLLAWAAVKPWIDRLRNQSSLSSTRYMPTSQSDGARNQTSSVGGSKMSRQGIAKNLGNGIGSNGGSTSRTGLASRSTLGPNSPDGGVTTTTRDEPFDLDVDHDAADIVSDRPSG